MRHDPRTTYAQSSDIKGRSYLEYRRDMKRKAIAELEALDWIQRLFESMYPNEVVSVKKSGGDSFLWFLRQGGVSREPDYIVSIGSKTQSVEFQYAASESLDFYDFKLSKVAVRRSGKRIPKDDVLFLYIDKPRSQYALLSAKWIAENAEIAEVPAWRSPAYRVPAGIFRQQLRGDESLTELIQAIDSKNILLEFQHELYEMQRDIFKENIERSVLENAEFVVVPSSLNGFYEACFILSALQKHPESVELWLSRAIKFANQADSLEQVFKVAFCLDFLYFCIPAHQQIEINHVVAVLNHLADVREQFYQEHTGGYMSNGNNPCLETRYALFAANVIEDMTQDILHYRFGKLNPPSTPAPIRRIYQSLRNPKRTAQFILKHCCD